MRYIIAFLIIYLLAGCVSSPPKPPAVKGEYRPINHVEASEASNRKTVTSPIYDFHVTDMGSIIAKIQDGNQVFI